MAKLIRQSRIVRKNQVLSTFVERKAEYEEAKIYFDSAYAKLKVEADKVLKLYVPLKNAVSNVNWDRKCITAIKISNGGKMIEVTLIENGTYDDHKSFWKFPAWMIGSTSDRIIEGLNIIIEEDSKRFAQQEQQIIEKEII